MKHTYRKLKDGSIEVRDKRTRVIWGYIHPRIEGLTAATNNRSTIMCVQKLGSDTMEEKFFYNRRDAREWLQINGEGA